MRYYLIVMKGWSAEREATIAHVFMLKSVLGKSYSIPVIPRAMSQALAATTSCRIDKIGSLLRRCFA